MTPLALPWLVTRGTWESWATFSECERYRYALGRCWDPRPDEGDDMWTWRRPIFSVVMLNPSTADHNVNDPTIRKCLHFAKAHGCGALLVRNLFAWRATDPRDLLDVEDPVGAANTLVLGLDFLFGYRVAAWGMIQSKALRRRAVRSISIARMSCSDVLKLTDRGHDRSSVFSDRCSREPRHPLYLPNATRCEKWRTLLEAG